MSIRELIEKTKVSLCQDCGVCTGSCPVSRVLPRFSPRTMVGKFMVSAELGMEDEALGGDDVWSCLTCGLCLERCPSRVEYLDFVRGVREEAAKLGNRTRYAHDGITQSLVQIQTAGLPQNKTAWAREAGNIQNEGEYYLFVGCLPYFDTLFREIGGRPLGTASNMIKILNRLGIEPVVSDEERCCGHDMLWNGNVDLFKELAAFNIDLIKRCGSKKVIFSCPEGYMTFKKYYPLYFPELDFEVVHLFELLAQQFADGGVQLDSVDRSVTYQDTCRLGRMAGIYEAPREIIAAIPGMKLEEMEHSGENAICCGVSCWANCNSYSKQIQIDRLKEAKVTGADLLITACPKCNIHFKCALSSNDMEIEVQELTDVIALAMGCVSV